MVTGRTDTAMASSLLAQIGREEGFERTSVPRAYFEQLKASPASTGSLNR